MFSWIALHGRRIEPYQIGAKLWASLFARKSFKGE
jgi:hypothetical protein